MIRVMAVLSLLLCLASSALSATIAPTASGIDITVGSQLTRVQALDGGAIVRVRIAPSGTLAEDASWAVPHASRAALATVTPIANGFTTSSLTVTADPTSGRLTITDAAGRSLFTDAATPLSQAGATFTLAKTIPSGAHFFGLGDKGRGADRAGKSFTLWNTDSPVNPNNDVTYKSLPFAVQVMPDGSAGGLLVDDTWQQSWDFGAATPGQLAVTANGGAVDYYVLAGPDAKAVMQHYMDLTGPAPLAPLYAYGYNQSRYSYSSTAEVESVADHFRADNIPLDMLWEDIDYQYGYRPFVVDDTHFASVSDIVTHLGQEKIRWALITDLHIAKTDGSVIVGSNGQYAGPYAAGLSGDHFVKKADGSLYTGNVWPSQQQAGYAATSVFPEFTRTASRAWWGSLYSTFYGQGVATFWNDMGEPSVFDGPSGTMPLDNQHRIDGDDFSARTATHAEVHNVYGMLNSRATFEGLLALKPGERPLVLTRATYAGGQRYAFTWTGDNASDYDQLVLSTTMILNLGLSGFSLVGADVGGFLGGPTANLLTRWYEVAAFQPFMRQHSVAGSRYSEPWTDGAAHEDIRRRYIAERYRLLPYIYAAADENSRTGAPVNRPVWMEYPSALTDGCDYNREFLLGAKLLVAVPHADADTAAICLPAGTWYDYWTGAQASGQQYRAADLGTLRVFAAAGAMIPRQIVTPSTQEAPHSSLQLDIFPGGNCGGSLYVDDGHTLGYRSGDYMRQALSCSVAGSTVTINFAAAQGSRSPWWSDVEIIVHGWSASSVRAHVGSQRMPAGVAGSTAVVRLPWRSSAQTVVLQPAG